MKKVLITVLGIAFISTQSTFVALAKGYNPIDFYKVFSTDSNINSFGNSIYNWSIYMPSDAVVSKNAKASGLSMYTNSYKTNVSVEVLKNVDNLSLEEIYANELGSNNDAPIEGDNSYICSSRIAKDPKNNKYISISMVTPESTDYKVNDDKNADEAGVFSQQRIYLGKNNGINYIYAVSIAMDLSYYKQHTGLFNKMADSFRTSFNANNPNVKDLADQVTTYRKVNSKIYGWEIELAPYWKASGVQNSTSQFFYPLYSDQEIGISSDISSEDDFDDAADTLDTANIVDTSDSDNQASEFQTQNQEQQSAEQSIDQSVYQQSQDNSTANWIKDSLNISVISSSPKSESFEKWADKEIRAIETNFNEELFTIITPPKDIKAKNVKGKKLVFKVNQTSQDSIVEGIVLLQGYGYRYMATLKMKESKYNEPGGKKTFDRMLGSFRLINSKNKFINDLASPQQILDYEAKKGYSMKKYALKILSTNSWTKEMDINNMRLDTDDGLFDGIDDSSSSESLSLNHQRSGAALDITADLLFDPFDQAISDYLSKELSKQDISSNVLDIKVRKMQIGNVSVYKIEETYNLHNMEELTKKDAKKPYNYSNLKNSYTYLFKQGNDFYTMVFSIPYINASYGNTELIKSLWQSVIVNGVKIGSQEDKWELVSDLSKYKKVTK
jgi:hypothetical protein